MLLKKEPTSTTVSSSAARDFTELKLLANVWLTFQVPLLHLPLHTTTWCMVQEEGFSLERWVLYYQWQSCPKGWLSNDLWQWAGVLQGGICWPELWSLSCQIAQSSHCLTCRSWFTILPRVAKLGCWLLWQWSCRPTSWKRLWICQPSWMLH